MVGATEARQEIEQQNRVFGEAYHRGDMAAVAALYTEDATVFPPDSPAVRGRTAIEQFFQAARAQLGIEDIALQSETVEASGELAYEVGTATLTLQPTGDVAPAVTARYVVVWKRHGGGPWQLAVDIWNSEAPPALTG